MRLFLELLGLALVGFGQFLKIWEILFIFELFGFFNILGNGDFCTFENLNVFEFFEIFEIFGFLKFWNF